MHANKSANVCFYGSGNNAVESDKSLPGKRFDCSTPFAFSGPLSVASKSVTCQGEMHKDVHFSMGRSCASCARGICTSLCINKPGWRIHAALKQGTLFEGSPGAFPGPTRLGCISLVTLQTPSLVFALRVRLREFKIAPGDFVFVQAKKVTRPQAKQGIAESEELSENKRQSILMKYLG